MKTKQSKIITICLVLILYCASFLSFEMGKIKERYEDEQLSTSGISIDFYWRYTYWDFIGVGLFLMATIIAISACRYFRYKKPVVQTNFFD